jgi:hypothetical protein
MRSIINRQNTSSPHLGLKAVQLQHISHGIGVVHAIVPTLIWHLPPFAEDKPVLFHTQMDQVVSCRACALSHPLPPGINQGLKAL